MDESILLLELGPWCGDKCLLGQNLGRRSDPGRLVVVVVGAVAIAIVSVAAIDRSRCVLCILAVPFIGIVLGFRLIIVLQGVKLLTLVLVIILCLPAVSPLRSRLWCRLPRSIIIILRRWCRHKFITRLVSLHRFIPLYLTCHTVANCCATNCSHSTSCSYAA